MASSNFWNMVTRNQLTQIVKSKLDVSKFQSGESKLYFTTFLLFQQVENFETTLNFLVSGQLCALIHISEQPFALKSSKLQSG